MSNFLHKIVGYRINSTKTALVDWRLPAHRPCPGAGVGVPFVLLTTTLPRFGDGRSKEKGKTQSVHTPTEYGHHCLPCQPCSVPVLIFLFVPATALELEACGIVPSIVISCASVTHGGVLLYWCDWRGELAYQQLGERTAGLPVIRWNQTNHSLYILESAHTQCLFSRIYIISSALTFEM